MDDREIEEIEPTAPEPADSLTRVGSVPEGHRKAGSDREVANQLRVTPEVGKERRR